MKPLKQNLGIIGFGNMAEAIVRGALQNSVIPPKQIYVLKHKADRDRNMKKKYHLQLAFNLQELCQNSEVILLSVKPQQMKEVLIALKPHLSKKHLILTIAAGLKVSYYKKLLGRNIKLIRIMPNTPAFIGQGAAAYFATQNATAKDKLFCKKFFGASGLITEVDKEKLIDAVIAVSGSGPAFLYKYAESVIQGGTKLGLSPQTAKELALQTLLGATQMLIETGETPETLIKKVTSKKGTTLAGLSVLQKNQFTNLIQKCMKAAAKRSEEISQELEKSL